MILGAVQCIERTPRNNKKDAFYDRDSIQKDVANRTYKSRIFWMVFSDRKELLALYNAVNETIIPIWSRGRSIRWKTLFIWREGSPAPDTQIFNLLQWCRKTAGTAGDEVIR